jgi:hypothetical protein
MSFRSTYYRLPGYRASVNIIYAVILRNLANAQAELRGLMISRRAAVSSS